MLDFPRPTPLVGAVLLEALRAAGLPATEVVVTRDVLTITGLSEQDRDAAQSVVDAHPAAAQAELDSAQTERANETTIRDRARTALVDNSAFLALTSPTNAQTLAQVKALTRQVNGLIRLEVRDLSGTD